MKLTYTLVAPCAILWIKRLVMRLSGILFMVCFLHISVWAYSQSLSLNVEGAKIETVLEQIEQQSEYMFFYRSDLLIGLEEVNLKVTGGGIEEVLDILFAESGLTYEIENTTVIIKKGDEKTEIYQAPKIIINGEVLDETGNVIPGASILIKGTDRGVVTDFNGAFSLNATEGDVLLVSFIGYVTIEVTVGTKTFYTVTLKEDIQNLETVMVLGSRSTPRTQLETVVPVDVIGTEVIENSPQNELSQVMQFVAPSFHSTKQNIGHGTDHVDPVSLRGLGSDQTLVLVNGKRRHASSLMNVNGTVGRGQVGTDLNAIPMSAIERIEVLRDGAAAQYGSDAIAGVINIVLKENINKGEVTVRTGFLAAPPSAPGFIEEFNSYNDNQNLSSIQGAGGGESFQVSANYGLAIGEKGGFINFNLNYLKKNPFNRMDDYTGELFSDDRAGDPTAEYAAFNQSDPQAIAAYNEMWGEQYGYAVVAPLNDYEGRRISNMGGSGTTNAGIMFNSEIPINDVSTFYAFGGYNYRLGSAVGFYRRPNQEGRQSGLWPLGFSPHLDSDIQDFSAAAGVRTKFNDWNVDISNTYGGNTFDWTIYNTNNASLGLESGTTFYAGGLGYSQNVMNLDISKGLDVGFPLNAAFGTEFRLENFQQIAGQDESWQNYGDTTSTGGLKESGSQVFPGYQRGNQIDKYRFNSGIYADFEADFTDKWLVGLAGRFEEYSDFGSNFSWKASSRYRVTDFFTVRGAYSTGFRAPSLPQKYFSSFTLQFITLDDGTIDGVNIAHLNDDSFVTRQFGIENLKPETSRNISVGATARLLNDNLSITVDAYQISIKDRIGITGRFSADDDPRFEEILDNAGLTQVQFMTNAVNTETRGLDVVLSYLLGIGDSDITLTAAANFTQTEIPRDENEEPIIKTGSFLEGFESQLFNREEISRLEVAQPRNKVILGAKYSYKNFAASITATRFGEVEYVNPSADPVANLWNEGVIESRDQTFTPKTLTDIDLSYRFFDTVKLAIGGSNIFNVYPDRHTHSGNYGDGMFPYSRRVSQFGLSGASYYTKLTFEF